MIFTIPFLFCLFVAIFVFEKWAAATFILGKGVKFYIEFTLWPEKVGNWPFLFSKVAAKNPVK